MPAEKGGISRHFPEMLCKLGQMPAALFKLQSSGAKFAGTKFAPV